MLVKNRKSGEVIDVPDRHATEVLLKQGAYLPVEEKKDAIEEVSETLAETIAPEKVKKKPGRPKKKSV